MSYTFVQNESKMFLSSNNTEWRPLEAVSREGKEKVKQDAISRQKIDIPVLTDAGVVSKHITNTF